MSNLRDLVERSRQVIREAAERDPETGRLYEQAYQAAEARVREIQAERNSDALASLGKLSTVRPDARLADSLLQAGVLRSGCSGADCSFGCSGGCAIVCIGSGGAGLAAAALGGTFGGSGTSIVLSSTLVAPTGPEL